MPRKIRMHRSIMGHVGAHSGWGDLKGHDRLFFGSRNGSSGKSAKLKHRRGGSWTIGGRAIQRCVQCVSVNFGLTMRLQEGTSDQSLL